jgi:hypothetical protein
LDLDFANIRVYPPGEYAGIDCERIVYSFKGKVIMKMRPVCLLALAFLGFVFPTGAQTGTVTFYSIDLSAKKQVKTALTPVGTVAFTGWLFDGDKRVAHATPRTLHEVPASRRTAQFYGTVQIQRPGEKTLPAHGLSALERRERQILLRPPQRQGCEPDRCPGHVSRQ